MRRRRHYATTGNRGLLDVEVTLPTDADIFGSDPNTGDGRIGRSRSLIMGDIAAVSDDTAELSLSVTGSAPIERIDIYDGLDLLETVRPYTAADLGARIRLVYEGAEYRGRARTTTWDGSLTLSGNEILRTAVINNWNLDRGIQKHDATSLAWKAVTTGNYGAIDLWLKTADVGHLSFKTAPVSGEVEIGDLGVEPRTFNAGGLERAIRLQKLPAMMTQRQISLTRSVKVRPQGDTRLYVRIQQEDGHRMWSSPIYLMRK
jgi:hypothetical protein